MDWYDNIKRYFDRGLWSVERIEMAVRCGVITRAQADEITGKTE